MTILVLVLYFVSLLAVAFVGQRFFRGTGDDYYTASRSLGPFVMLMALFGSHMTAFSILGASAEAYRRGIGVFSLMASSSAVVVPLILFFIAPRVWRLGRDFGFVTQSQLFRARWASEAIGTLTFLLLTILLVPYLLISMKGGGLTLAQLTQGQIPPWLGGLIIAVVVLLYVGASGMRGTAWANTYQAILFTGLGGLALFAITSDWGGLHEAFRRLGEIRPDLLTRESHIAPLELATYTLIPLSAGMFPHLFMQWLAAEKADHYRTTMVGYPICLVLVWLPSVSLGALAHLDFPNLEGPAINGVFLQLVRAHTSEIMTGLIAAGVLAAVMSLDSQVLAASNMFVNDVVKHHGFHDRISDSQVVGLGRAFVFAIVAIAYLISLQLDSGIYAIAVWSFTGYAGLFPLIVAALFWRRSTAAGAIACVVTVVVCLAFFLWNGLSADRGLAGSGVLPVAIVLTASTLALVVVSLLTKAPAPEIVDRFVGASSVVKAKRP